MNKTPQPVISRWLWITLIVVILIAAGYFGWYYLIGSGKNNAVVTIKTDETANPQVIESNIFDVMKAKIGDVVVNMTIKAITPFSVNITPPKSFPLTADNAKVEFSGQTQISGTYQYYGNDEQSEMLTDIVCFDGLDNSSKSQLPQIQGDRREPWFCFSNQDLAKELFIPKGAVGKATIIIDQYEINSYPSEVFNTATLIKVITKS